MLVVGVLARAPLVGIPATRMATKLTNEASHFHPATTSCCFARGVAMPIRLFCLSALGLFMLCGCASDTLVAEQRATGSGTATPSAAAQTTSAPSPQNRPSTHQVRECTAQGIVAHFRPEGDGAGGHSVSLLDFRNVSTTRCLLSGYPSRVTVSEPGHRVVTATEGSFFPAPDSESMQPGGVTTLGVETQTMCAARPGGGPSGPMYHEVHVALRGGVITIASPRGLDVGCGLHLTQFTNWK